MRERKFVLSSTIYGNFLYVPIWAPSLEDAAENAMKHWDENVITKPESIRVTPVAEFRRLFPTCEL